MKVIVCKTKEEASQKACEIMTGIVKANPKANLGLATGSTPVQLYANMVEDHKVNGTSYKEVKTFNLDEYFGLEQSHPQSYHYFMCYHLFNHIDVDMNNVHVPKGTGNIEEEADNYNKMLAENVLDIQLLGIGSNGHIGFNEPGTPFDSKTHKVDLKQSTIEDNARLFFDGKIEDVPTQAVSMGIANIMEAKKVLLLAFGEGKQDAVWGMVEGPKTEELPASALQDHPDCVLIVDEAAAAKLTK